MKGSWDDTFKERLVIAISGLHGTGKSTQAKRLAEAFGLRYVSIGTIFRRMSEERGLSPEEMSRIAEEDPEIDRSLDERTKAESSSGGVVIDATLSGWMAKNAHIKIMLTAPLDARLMRIAVRDRITLDEAREKTILREHSERERFKRFYGINVSDLSIYDVVINTELFDPSGTARILKRVVEEYCSGR